MIEFDSAVNTIEFGQEYFKYLNINSQWDFILHEVNNNLINMFFTFYKFWRGVRILVKCRRWSFFAKIVNGLKT